MIRFAFAKKHLLGKHVRLIIGMKVKRNKGKFWIIQYRDVKNNGENKCDRCDKQYGNGNEYYWEFSGPSGSSFLGIHDTLNIFWKHYKRMEKFLPIRTIIVPEWTWWLGASPWICLVYQLLRLWGTELRQAFLKGFSFFPLLFFSFLHFHSFLPPRPFFFLFGCTIRHVGS